MLFTSHVLDGLAQGAVDLAFRAWKRSAVHVDSTFRSPVGVVRVHSVDQVPVSSISESDARRAGYSSRQELMRDLKAKDETLVFRIGINVIGPDPRIALREMPAGPDDIAAIKSRLDRFDRASPRSPWTRATLRIIQTNPAVRASNLAEHVGMETLSFKRQVRRLKELGLTESLGTGYRLSPRGESFLASE